MANIFESINNTTDKAVDIGEKYLKDTQEYYRLKIFEQLSISISMMAKVLAIGGLLFIGLIFLSVAAAIAIGNWLDSIPLGYVVVAVIFFVLGLVLYLNRTIINRTIISKLSPKFFNF